uniref:Uncharacterized protein n=1 Tax=Parascaris equorum TaxID=6256 RepID=A0A914S049_PAREQ
MRIGTVQRSTGEHFSTAHSQSTTRKAMSTVLSVLPRALISSFIAFSSSLMLQDLRDVLLQPVTSRSWFRRFAPDRLYCLLDRDCYSSMAGIHCFNLIYAPISLFSVVTGCNM